MPTRRVRGTKELAHRDRYMIGTVRGHVRARRERPKLIHQKLVCEVSCRERDTVRTVDRNSYDADAGTGRLMFLREPTSPHGGLHVGCDVCAAGCCRLRHAPHPARRRTLAQRTCHQSNDHDHASGARSRAILSGRRRARPAPVRGGRRRRDSHPLELLAGGHLLLPIAATRPRTRAGVSAGATRASHLIHRGGAGNGDGDGDGGGDRVA